MSQKEMDPRELEEKERLEEKELEGVAGGLAAGKVIAACACDCEDGCCTDCGA